MSSYFSDDSPVVAGLRERGAQYEGDPLDLTPAPRVLHVDGDHDAAMVLAMLLVPETHVTHVPTLAAAAQAIETQQFALVVLDPDLPDGDGAVLIDALREACADTPVLLYSARQPEQRNLASAFLPKPWTSPRQLWRTISELLGIATVTTVEPHS